MKNPVADYMKQAAATLKGIDFDQLADLVHRTGLPIEIRRSRPSLFRQILKYAIIPGIVLALIVGFLLFRKLIVCNICGEDSGEEQKTSDEKSGAAPQNSNGSAPVNEAQSWTPGVDGNTQKTEIS